MKNKNKKNKTTISEQQTHTLSAEHVPGGIVDWPSPTWEGRIEIQIEKDHEDRMEHEPHPVSGF